MVERWELGTGVCISDKAKATHQHLTCRMRLHATKSCYNTAKRGQRFLGWRRTKRWPALCSPSPASALTLDWAEIVFETLLKWRKAGKQFVISIRPNCKVSYFIADSGTQHWIPSYLIDCFDSYERLQTPSDGQFKCLGLDQRNQGFNITQEDDIILSVLRMS